MKASRKRKSAGLRTDSQKSGPASGSFRLNRRKLWCFRLLVAMGVPTVVLGMMELTLRLVGFGYPTGFLLPSQSDGQKVFVQNNRFGWRFFGAAMARIPEPICISQVKNPNTVRIVVFGESAALGDPQPAFRVAANVAGHVGIALSRHALRGRECGDDRHRFQRHSPHRA